MVVLISNILILNLRLLKQGEILDHSQTIVITNFRVMVLNATTERRDNNNLKQAIGHFVISECEQKLCRWCWESNSNHQSRQKVCRPIDHLNAPCVDFIFVASVPSLATRRGIRRVGLRREQIDQRQPRLQDVAEDGLERRNGPGFWCTGNH